MKNAIFCLLTLAAPTLSLANVLQSKLPDDFYSCTSKPVGKNNYYYTLTIQGEKLNIYQVANNAKYVPLHYSITALGNEMPQEQVQMSCTRIDSEFIDGYQYTIEVYKDKLAVLQQSNHARFAPIVWNIFPLTD